MMIQRYLLLTAAVTLLAGHSIRFSRADESSEAIPDGIYHFTAEGPGQKVERSDTDGGVIYLGERVTDQLGKGTIQSRSNDNSWLSLQLVGAGPVPEGAE